MPEARRRTALENLPGDDFNSSPVIAGPRGAVPGSVVNGITWHTPGDDRPYLDLRGIDIPDFQPNEVWLPHNTAWLGVLAWMGGE